jgi:hypothetical protein
MLNWLRNKLAEPAIKQMLKGFAEILIAFLVSKTISEVYKYVGKFIPVGGTIFGRRYAFVLTLSDIPPADHPHALHMGVVSNKDWGYEFHLWAVSFPKDRWEKIPESQKVHLKL